MNYINLSDAYMVTSEYSENVDLFIYLAVRQNQTLSLVQCLGDDSSAYRCS